MTTTARFATEDVVLHLVDKMREEALDDMKGMYRGFVGSIGLLCGRAVWGPRKCAFDPLEKFCIVSFSWSWPPLPTPHHLCDWASEDWEFGPLERSMCDLSLHNRPYKTHYPTNYNPVKPATEQYYPRLPAAPPPSHMPHPRSPKTPPSAPRPPQRPTPPTASLC